MEIRRSYDRLISTMGFPILVRQHLYTESGPRYPKMIFMGICSSNELPWPDLKTECLDNSPINGHQEDMPCFNPEDIPFCEKPSLDVKNLADGISSLLAAASSSERRMWHWMVRKLPTGSESRPVEVTQSILSLA